MCQITQKKTLMYLLNEAGRRRERQSCRVPFDLHSEKNQAMRLRKEKRMRCRRLVLERRVGEQ